ncbi:hypothetical protein Tco_0384881 [Tanacetum coccineum]
MMTYLKHVGGKKHSDLKTKNFEEIQVLYEKVKRSDENFIAIGSAEDERLIKDVNKKATGIKKDASKEDEITRKRKLGTRKKMKSRKRRFRQDTFQDDQTDSKKENEELRLCLTIATDEDKEVDYEIFDKKYHIIECKTEYLGTKPQFDETKRLEEINLNVVIRSNGQRRYFNDEDEFWNSQQDWNVVSWKLHRSSGHLGIKPQYDETKDFEEINLNVVIRRNGQRRYFSTLIRVLSIFDRDDLSVVYQLVMDIYKDEIPKGLECSKWTATWFFRGTYFNDYDEGLVHLLCLLEETVILLKESLDQTVPGTDKAKTIRKTVKTGQTRTQERKSTQKARRKLSKLKNPKRNATFGLKEAQRKWQFTLVTLSKEAQAVSITDCQAGNPCEIRCDPTTKFTLPIIERMYGQDWRSHICPQEA